MVLDIEPHDSFLHLLLRGLFLEVVGKCGAAREVDQAFCHVASLDQVVVAVQLCVGLFQCGDPDLVVFVAREHGQAHWVAGEVVVDGDAHPLAVLAEFDAVDAGPVDVFGDEEALDQAWALHQTGHRTQEPGVPELALVDVGGLDIVAEDGGVLEALCVVHTQVLRGPAPVQQLVEGVLVELLVDRGVQRGELRVDEVDFLRGQRVLYVYDRTETDGQSAQELLRFLVLLKDLGELFLQVLVLQRTRGRFYHKTELAFQHPVASHPQHTHRLGLEGLHHCGLY